MSAESDLYAALSGSLPVTSLVGTRISSDAPDQGAATPYVFYERVDTDVISSLHDGTPIAEITRLNLVCYGAEREDAEDLGNKAVTAVTAAGFIYTGRQGEYDPETKFYAAVLGLQHNQ